jgi:hypothetical protein
MFGSTMRPGVSAVTGNVHAVLSPVLSSGKGRSLMPLVDMKDLERRAADLVTAELGAATWVLRDTPGLGIQMRDYDVIFADGHCEPLEVTTDADRNVLNTRARMEGNDRIAHPGKRVWAVSVPNTSTDAAGKKRHSTGRRALNCLFR